VNQTVRDKAIFEAARRNGVSPERLRFLQENPDQVTSTGGDKGLDEYRPTSTEVGHSMGSIGVRRRDPMERLPLLDEKSDGLLVTREYENGDGHRLTSRQMSMERLKAYIPPAEPDLPGIGIKYLGPVTPQILLDVGRAETIKEARSMLRKSKKGLLVIEAIPARDVALASYKKEHPGYDDAVGTIQVPTPELYEHGGLYEDIFQGEAKDDLDAALNRRNAEAATLIDNQHVFPALVAAEEDR
jgi:hypothetical protein